VLHAETASQTVLILCRYASPPTGDDPARRSPSPSYTNPSHPRPSPRHSFLRTAEERCHPADMSPVCDGHADFTAAVAMHHVSMYAPALLPRSWLTSRWLHSRWAPPHMRHILEANATPMAAMRSLVRTFSTQIARLPRLPRPATRAVHAHRPPCRMSAARIELVPCLDDNYSFLVHDADSGITAAVDPAGASKPPPRLPRDDLPPRGPSA